MRCTIVNDRPAPIPGWVGASKPLRRPLATLLRDLWQAGLVPKVRWDGADHVVITLTTQHGRD